MSHTRPASTSSSSNSQIIFNNALKVYERRTKHNLLAHPLAVQLQSCKEPSNILILLQQQVQELNHSQSSDERLTKWLNPTVNVLYAFSKTLGEGVSLVCPVIPECPRSLFPYYFIGIFARESNLCRNRNSPSSAYPSQYSRSVHCDADGSGSQELSQRSRHSF